VSITPLLPASGAVPLPDPATLRGGHAIGSASRATPQVVVVSRRFPPVVAVRIAVASGSLRDPEGQEGRALLCWQTALRGTLQRTRAEQAETLESLGANLEVAVDKHGATLHGEVLLEHLPVWLSLGSRRVVAPAV
jgi:predicted Zn-dependent peptidase